MQDMRRSIIANLINRSQPAQLRQQMQDRIGASQYPGYMPLNAPPAAPPAAPAAGMEFVYKKPAPVAQALGNMWWDVLSRKNGWSEDKKPVALTGGQSAKPAPPQSTYVKR